MARLTPLAPLTHGQRSQGRAWRAYRAPCRQLPALLCALVTILSLTLSACASALLPPGHSPTPTRQANCRSYGEAGPPTIPYQLNVTPPVAADGVVYVGYTVRREGPPNQTLIAALRASDGTLLWSVPDSNGTDHLVLADGTLILLGRGIVGLRASDGTSLWSTMPWHSFGVLPWAISAGILYVIHDAVYAFRISVGTSCGRPL